MIADGRRVDKMSCSRADGRLEMSPRSSLITASVSGVAVPDPGDGFDETNCCVGPAPCWL